ncbi:hypothetical protein L083_3351 [Actinoplanes sp. N902-109]|nr:hypothetical protein L083_3351 [Actinoplanes sp. N902-109]
MTTVSPVRQRAARLACGLLIAAFAVAAVAVNTDVRGFRGAGTGLWVAAGVLAVACGAAGGWWFSTVRADRRRPAGTLTPGEVASGTSSTADGTVTVALTLADGSARSYSARGHQGALLAGEFGRLLAVHP